MGATANIYPFKVENEAKQESILLDYFFDSGVQSYISSLHTLGTCFQVRLVVHHPPRIPAAKCEEVNTRTKKWLVARCCTHEQSI